MSDKLTSNNELLLTKLLKDVSRSFYLTLRVLPSSSRTPISIAYLLARAADTIADTPLIAPSERERYLSTLQQLLSSDEPALLEPIITNLNSNTGNHAECILISRLADIYALYRTCDDHDRQMITQVVSTLIGGMNYDLTTFPSEESGQLGALTTAADLDHYTYMVAGCVGEFWTDICFQHEPTCKHWQIDLQKERGIRLGKALQLTNVLRDIAQDLRIGRCYLPEQELQVYGLSPQNLLQPQSAAQAKPLLDHWIRTALAHYQAGADYAMTIPRHAIRLRLAVFWPMLIGLATLRLLANNPNWLSPATRIKVPRSAIYKIIVTSVPLVASNQIMMLWLKRLHTEVEHQLLSQQPASP